jgi:hypothetical protein
MADYFLSAAGVVPWRCLVCERRFHARAIPLGQIFYARCGICGNLELQRISAEKVPGVMSRVGRGLGLSAFRCAPCRYKFFSLRPMLPAEQIARERAESPAAKY